MNTRLAVVGAAVVSLFLLQTHVFSHDEGPTTSVMFDREIVRILNDRCVVCHADNGLSFRLSTHDDVYARAQAIKTAVLRRRMPPWSAVPAYGDFDNDNHLTRHELDFLVSWFTGGAPRNGDCLPATRTLGLAECEAASKQLREEAKADPHFGHWRHGEPDVQRPLPAFTVRPGSGDTRVVFDLGFSTPRDVNAWEYQPDDRSVTQAVAFSIEGTGQWLGTWTPWRGYAALPDGSAYALAPGTRIVADIYYRAAANGQVKGGTFGVSFAERPASRRPSDIVLEMNAGHASAEAVLTSDVDVLAIWPDPGLTAGPVDIVGVLPTGETRVLLVLRPQGSNWPTPYVLRKPVALPKGTRLTVAAKTSGRFKVTVSAIQSSRLR